MFAACWAGMQALLSCCRAEGSMGQQHQADDLWHGHLRILWSVRVGWPWVQQACHCIHCQVASSTARCRGRRHQPIATICLCGCFAARPHAARAPGRVQHVCEASWASAATTVRRHSATGIQAVLAVVAFAAHTTDECGGSGPRGTAKKVWLCHRSDGSIPADLNFIVLEAHSGV